MELGECAELPEADLLIVMGTSLQVNLELKSRELGWGSGECRAEVTDQTLIHTLSSRLTHQELT